MQEETRIQESNLRDLYYVLFRHKKKVIVFFIAVVVTVTLWEAMLPDFYRSDAKLLVKIGRESVALVPTPATGQTISINKPIVQEINAELEMLKSRELAEKIVDEFGADVILLYPEKAAVNDSSATALEDTVAGMTVEEMRSAINNPDKSTRNVGLNALLKKHDKATLAVMKSLDIRIQPSSNIILLSSEARTPNLAYAIVSRLIDLYLKKRIKVQGTSASYEFLVGQSDTLYNQLVETQNKLSKLKNRIKIGSLNEQRTMLTGRIGTLQQEREATEANLTASKRKIEELKKMLPNLPEMVETGRVTVDNEVHTQLRQHLLDLRQQEQDLLSKYKKDAQGVKEVRRQIADTEEALKREEPTHVQVTEGINTSLQQSQIDLKNEEINFASLQAKSETLRGQIANVQKELAQLNDAEIEMKKLELEESIRENNYNEYAKNLEQARIDKEMQQKNISNISIMEEASYPMEKSGPNKRRNVFAGVFVAFLGSIGLAFTAEYLDNTIKTPEDVRKRLNMDTLVNIAYCPTSKKST